MALRDSCGSSKTGEDAPYVAVGELRTRFLSPRAVAIDGAGDLYVACAGWTGGVEKFRRSDLGGELVGAWHVEGGKAYGVAAPPGGGVYVTVRMPFLAPGNHPGLTVAHA